jgi:hypothetical protein
VAVVVIVVTGPATYFSWFGIYHRHYGVVHDSLAANAKIVDVVAQAWFPHVAS